MADARSDVSLGLAKSSLAGIFHCSVESPRGSQALSSGQIICLCCSPEAQPGPEKVSVPTRERDAPGRVISLTPGRIWVV